jgi:peptidoglycan hydrolase-like protein with peptidoglycan-binding domain
MTAFVWAHIAQKPPIAALRGFDRSPASSVLPAFASQPRNVQGRPPLDLMRLQSLAGNRAVSQLVAGPSPHVQRCGTVACDCADDDLSDAPGLMPSQARSTVQRLTEEERADDLQSSRYAANERLQRAFDNDPPVKVFASGEHIRLIQEGLVEAGFELPGSTKPTGELDGVFGQETLSAVQGFQTEQGLDVDGVVGRQTMRALDELALSNEQTAPATGDEESEECVPEAADEEAASADVARADKPATCKKIGLDPLTKELRRNAQIISTPARIARIKSKITRVDLTLGPPPFVVAFLNAGDPMHMSLERFFKGQGEADLEPDPDLPNADFGFVQICRPQEVQASSYRDGAGHDKGAAIRAQEPALDAGGGAFSGAPVKPIAGKVVAPFEDQPGEKFDVSSSCASGGLLDRAHWETHFFTAFVVRLPNEQAVIPLRTFSWHVEFCKRFTAAEITRGGRFRGKQIRVDPIRDCFSGACGIDEPQFLELSSKPTGVTCNTIVNAVATTCTANSPKLSCSQ